MSDPKLDEPKKIQQPKRIIDTYSNKPPLGFALLVWFFPVWWLAGYMYSLYIITAVATKFGIDLPARLSMPVLIAPFFLIPPLWGALWFRNYNWFRRRIGYAIIVWLVLIVVFDLTQGAMMGAFCKAAGCPPPKYEYDKSTGWPVPKFQYNK